MRGCALASVHAGARGGHPRGPPSGPGQANRTNARSSLTAGLVAENYGRNRRHRADGWFQSHAYALANTFLEEKP